MFCTSAENRDEFGPIKLAKDSSSNSFQTVPRRLFCCGSLLPIFGVRVSMTFNLMFIHIMFSSV